MATRHDASGRISTDPIKGHVLYPRFGEHVDLIKNFRVVLTKKNGLQPFDKSIYLLEEYLHNFGIVDLDNPSCSPLALIELHEKEGLFELDLDEKRHNDYILYKVWDTYHISFNEFVDLPRHEIERMLKRLRMAIEEKMKSLNAQEDKDGR